MKAVSEVDIPGILLMEDEYDDANLTLRVLRKYRIVNHVETIRDRGEALSLLRKGF